MAVADRLAERHDVRQARSSEPPHLVARAAEAGLHLVGDEEAAGGADRARRVFEIALGRQDRAVRVEDDVAQPGGGAYPALLEFRDRRVDVRGVLQAEIRRAIAVFAAVALGGGTVASQAGCSDFGYMQVDAAPTTFELPW